MKLLDIYFLGIYRHFGAVNDAWSHGQSLITSTEGRNATFGLMTSATNFGMFCFNDYTTSLVENCETSKSHLKVSDFLNTVASVINAAAAANGVIGLASNRKIMSYTEIIMSVIDIGFWSGNAYYFLRYRGFFENIYEDQIKGLLDKCSADDEFRFEINKKCAEIGKGAFLRNLKSEAKDRGLTPQKFIEDLYRSKNGAKGHILNFVKHL